jgi:hypothetical protein
VTITYFYSACIAILTKDLRILCDPWWGNSAYDGAWTQWPQWAGSLGEAIERLGEATYVYLSHKHPDHFDMPLLRAYLHRYPEAKVIIAKHTPPLLERKLRSRGIEPIVLGVSQDTHWALAHKETTILAVANKTSVIDSALAVKWRDQSVVNLNDNPYDPEQVNHLLEQGKPTVGLFPFVGAGPWPQCYHFDEPQQQIRAAIMKRHQYLDLFKRYVDAFMPNVAVPFAGQYWLHGPQIDLNPLRGMADATECRGLEYLPGAGEGLWVPADGGESTLTVETNGTTWWNTERTTPYDWPTVREALRQKDANDLMERDWQWLYRYEQEIKTPVERLPLLKLLHSAARNAAKEFDGAPTLYVCIKTQLPQWFFLKVGTGWIMEGEEEVITQRRLRPRYEVHVDARYLFGGLTRLYNMNNIRIGSLATFKVVPMEPFNERLYDLFGAWWDALRV